MPTKLRDKNRPESDGGGKDGSPSNQQRRRFVIAAWGLTSILLLIITQSRYLLTRDKALSYREGDRVTADFFLSTDISFVDEEATANLAAFNKDSAPPVYVISDEITRETLENFDRFSSLYLGTRVADPDAAEEAAVALAREFPNISRILTDEGKTSDRLDGILSEIRDLLRTIQYAGLFSLDDDDGGAVSGIVEVDFSEAAAGRRITIARDAVTTVEKLGDRLATETAARRLSEGDDKLVIALTRYFARVNGFYSRDLTLENRREAEGETEPVTVSLPSGTLLLKEGDVVTRAQERALEALRKRGGAPGIREILYPFYVSAFLFALGIFSFRIFRLSFRKQKNLTLYTISAGLYLLIVLTVSVFVTFPNGLMMAAAIPTVLFTLVLDQLLQDRRIALVTSVLMAVLLLFLMGPSPIPALYTLAAGIAGTVAVGRRETRMGFLRSGPRLALILSLSAAAVGFAGGVTPRFVLISVGIAAVNGVVTGILSLAFLPLLEHLLNTATTFRLIELSDQNVPILKKMRLQAPGTYIHSQNVAHLAEAACEAIGADGLLARVGSYYHDIGKVDQANYFVENQNGENRHDDLKATLSAAVIKSHVKIGLEKARDLRLPDEVLEVIAQHHGTSVIQYFYDRAVKEKGAGAASPDDFSYGGPKPGSKEAAVVMLADSAEAATRTLKKPTAAKLEKYVWDLIMYRFKTGELNECDLTLRDLERVKEAFCQVLTGHFHTRIAYPGDKEAEDSA